ncbi:MAG TPA: hypothetical protein VGE42_02480, partial [Candidatus Dormibacteraeota bacterium]
TDARHPRRRRDRCHDVGTTGRLTAEPGELEPVSAAEQLGATVGLGWRRQSGLDHVAGAAAAQLPRLHGEGDQLRREHTAPRLSGAQPEPAAERLANHAGAGARSAMRAHRRLVRRPRAASPRA